MTGKAMQPFAGPAYPPWWTVSESYVHQGKPVAAGQQLTITDERGTVFTFVNHTVAPPRPGSGKRTTLEWITVVGPYGFRSFRPDRISRILPPPRGKKKAR
jgi:hypothetical protein